jgi:SNF2 Helicase protein/SNF2-related domain
VIVVHGWWSRPAGPGDAGALTLWAEDALGPIEGQRRPGRKPRVRDHPFAVDGEQLAKVLGLGDVEVGSEELVLPAYSHAPSASPELLDLRSSAREGAEGETLRLRPETRWRVPVVRVDASSALVLLPWLGGGPGTEVDGPLGPGGPGDPGDPDQEARTGIASVLGADLRGLAALADFAVDVARRGRVLPVVIAAGPGRALARWRPVLTGADAEWFRALVAALPASFAAAAPDAAGQSTTANESTAAGELAAAGQSAVVGQSAAAGELAAAAVDALVDAAVRHRIGAAPTSKGSTNGLPGWRRALRGDAADFEVTERQFARLAHDLGAWQVDARGGGAVRACFRLVEPTDDDEASVLRRPSEPNRSAQESEHWRLEFGLQPVDEPSLIVAAERIWSGGPVQLLARHAPRPEETLLAELGRALRLYPVLSAALSGPRPAEMLLDNAGAHTFLAEVAPLLLGAGFGVLLPGWWGNPRARLGARLRAGTPSQPGRVDGVPQVGQSAIVEFDWRLSIGDELLSDRDVEALIERQQSLVKIRGEWMQVDTERLRRARDFLRRRKSAGDMTVGEVLHVLGAADQGPGGLPVTGVDAEGWLGELLAPSADQTVQPIPTPTGFTGTLRPYQERGLSWLAFLESAGLGALLADDMGLGKTVQLLALIAHDLEVRGGPGVHDHGGAGAGQRRAEHRVQP